MWTEIIKNNETFDTNLKQFFRCSHSYFSLLHINSENLKLENDWINNFLISLLYT